MKAFLVLGGESTGTRMVTQSLCEAGCYGDHGHQQRLDNSLPIDQPLVVWRRSVPHARKMPDIQAMISRLEDFGYEVTAVVVTRDWACAAKSQVKAPHAPDVETAYKQLKEAYRHIFANLTCDYIMVSYESLLLHGELAIKPMIDYLGLVKMPSFPIYDRNLKHLV